ncbi:hypothetical protein GCM10009527_091240 [Actinomadura nitritigenes]
MNTAKHTARSYPASPVTAFDSIGSVHSVLVAARCDRVTVDVTVPEVPVSLPPGVNDQGLGDVLRSCGSGHR